ncbi:MAG: alanyl-tRNA editing protein [Synergistota bacterium]|nr:alanyl-tRNA editing protein [Synergistota bacterium]
MNANEKKRRYTLLISGSLLRPSGGGQPGDRGELRGDGFHFTIQDSERHDEGVAVSGVANGAPVEGMPLEERVDLELRAVYSRMHTGEHILSRALERAENSLRILKVAVGEEESVVYLDYPGELNWDIIFAAETEANEIVKRDLPVEVLLLSREEAEDLPGIRGKWERITDDTIRVVRIPDFDVIACSGTHVSSTGEVGDILVTAFKGPAPGWEIRYKTSAGEERDELSRIARRLAREASCPPSRLETVFNGLRSENGVLTKALERASHMIEIPWEIRSADETRVFVSVIPGVPKDLVSASARRWSNDHPDSIVLLLLPDFDGGRGVFLLYRGSEVGRDFTSFIRSSPSLSAKGGGRSDWLNGSSGCMKPGEWLRALDMFLRV